jgi:hypothetical protein
MSESGEFPELPALNDPRWQMATFQGRKNEDTIDIYNKPRATLSKVLLTLNKGDVVSIIRDVRHETWIAAKVDKVCGWVDASGVGFSMARMPKARASTAPYKKPSEDIDDVRATEPRKPQGLQEQLQQNAVNYDEPAVLLTAGEVSYIMTHLKGIAETLQRGRVRAEIEAASRTPG